MPGSSRPSQKAVNAIVHGRVQGVSYRYWTRQEAKKRGISGWVRNRSDGSVEAMLVGDDDVVEELLSLMSIGPPLAEVSRVERVEKTSDGGADLPETGRAFEILSTFQLGRK